MLTVKGMLRLDRISSTFDTLCIEKDLEEWRLTANAGAVFVAGKSLEDVLDWGDRVIDEMKDREGQRRG